MKEILLKGKIIKLDSSDYEIIKDNNLNFIYLKNGHPYIYTMINSKSISILKLIFETNSKNYVKFINGDHFDLRRENVKVVMKSHIKKISSTLISEYNNVSYDIKYNMWISRIYFNGKHHFNGRYYLEKEAALASDYFIMKNLKESEVKNFKKLSPCELEVEYKNIIEKYGKNVHERNTLKAQGKKLNRKNKQSSKYVGVSKLKDPNRKKPWVSEIRKDKKRYSLGYFETEEEAAQAYNDAAINLYGVNARLNIIEKKIPSY